MKDILFLEKMFTPKIIQLLYWINAVMIVLATLGSLFIPYTGFTHKLILLIGMVVALLFNRILCEVIILLFNIYKELKFIADQKKS